VTPAELRAMVREAERLFVKIDIEGGEYELLPSLAPLLEGPGCTVLVSFHPKALAALRPRREDQVALTAAALTALAGFSCFAVDADGAVAQIPDAAGIVARTQPDEWLFVKRR
jgi:hypothetical protein